MKKNLGLHRPLNSSKPNQHARRVQIGIMRFNTRDNLFLKVGLSVPDGG